MAVKLKRGVGTPRSSFEKLLGVSAAPCPSETGGRRNGCNFDHKAYSRPSWKRQNPCRASGRGCQKGELSQDWVEEKMRRVVLEGALREGCGLPV